MINSSTSEVPVTNATNVRKFLQFRWWFIAVPLLIITIIGQVDKVVISMVMANKQFLQDLDLVGKPAITGLLMSGFLLSYALCQFFWGYFVKKFGPRISAMAGIMIWGGTMILSGIAQTASALITARIILGVGEAFIFPVAHAFVANWFPVKERGRATSIWLNGMTLGPVVCGALVVAVMAAGGWRTIFYVLAALSILIPLPMAFFLMTDRPSQNPKVSIEELRLIEEGSLAKTKEVPQVTTAEGKSVYLADHRFWLVTLAWGFNNVFFWGWATWMPTYFQKVHNFSFKAAGYIYSLTFLFQLITVLIVGYYSDRTMRRAPFGAAGWIIAGILMFVGGALVSDPYWALLVLIIAVCCQQPAFMMSQTLLQSIIPERSMGDAVGFSGGVAQLMAVISPTFIGYLLQVSGFGFVIAFLALASLIPGILTLFLAKEGY